jgi:hypothetical protein
MAEVEAQFQPAIWDQYADLRFEDAATVRRFFFASPLETAASSPSSTYLTSGIRRGRPAFRFPIGIHRHKNDSKQTEFDMRRT